jgi:hypothetical protein
MVINRFFSAMRTTLLIKEPGAEMAIQWYMRLIIRDLARLDNSALEVVPANRRIVGEFIGSSAISFVDDILAGIQGHGFNGFDWDHDFLFSQFKKYIISEMSRMEKNLDKLLFNIDQENTLTVITGGGGRPETVCLLLLSRPSSV